MRMRKTSYLMLMVLIVGSAILVPTRVKAQNQGFGAPSGGSQQGTVVTAADMQRAQDAYQLDLQRQAIARDKAGFVQQIMNRWSTEIGDNEKGHDGFEAALMADDVEKLLKISQAQTWNAVIAISLGFEPSIAANASTNGDAGTNVLGDHTQDLVFVPLTPCRVLDTRLASGVWAGPFSNLQTVSF